MNPSSPGVQIALAELAMSDVLPSAIREDVLILRHTLRSNPGAAGPRAMRLALDAHQVVCAMYARSHGEALRLLDEIHASPAWAEFEARRALCADIDRASSTLLELTESIARDYARALDSEACRSKDSNARALERDARSEDSAEDSTPPGPSP